MDIEIELLPIVQSLYDYSFLKPLGMGSHGLVCQYHRDGTNYAIKFISAQSTNPISFQREIDVLYYLNRYNLPIPKIYSHGCIFGTHIISSMNMDQMEEMIMKSPRGTVHTLNPNHEYYVIVTEYIEGEDLSVFMKNNQLSDDNIYIIAQTLFGLIAVLHKEGIVHRDIKPGNILVTSDNELVLVDFGFACSFEEPIIMCPKEAVGTPLTLSPEIWQNKITDKNLMAADVWAAGVTLFFVLNGKYPWNIDPKYDRTREGKLMLGYSIITSPHPESRELFPLNAVIDFALFKDPLIRPPAIKLYEFMEANIPS